LSTEDVFLKSAVFICGCPCIFQAVIMSFVCLYKYFYNLKSVTIDDIKTDGS